MFVTVKLQVYLNDKKRCLETLIKTIKVLGHVNSWVRVTHERHEHQYPTKNNDSTVVTIRHLYFNDKSILRKKTFASVNQFQLHHVYYMW